MPMKLTLRVIPIITFLIFYWISTIWWLGLKLNPISMTYPIIMIRIFQHSMKNWNIMLYCSDKLYNNMMRVMPKMMNPSFAFVWLIFTINEVPKSNTDILKIKQYKASNQWSFITQCQILLTISMKITIISIFRLHTKIKNACYLEFLISSK